MEEDKAALQHDLAQYRKLPDEIGTRDLQFNFDSIANIKPEKMKKNLERFREGLAAARKRLLEHDEQIDQAAMKQAKLVLQHSRRLGLLRDANKAVLEAHTCLIEAASDVEALELRSQDIVQRLNEEGAKVEKLDDEVKRVKKEAQSAQTAAMEALGDPERKALIVQLAEGKTMEGVTEDIDAENARLELIHDTDPGLLRDFEQRARKIEKAQQDMASRQASLGQLEETIQEIKEKWEPALDDIITRINNAFSYNFEQINCAGEVGVHKDEDFDKWSIEIKVKFRYAFRSPNLIICT